MMESAGAKPLLAFFNANDLARNDENSEREYHSPIPEAVECSERETYHRISSLVCIQESPTAMSALRVAQNQRQIRSKLGVLPSRRLRL
jgi:hypothetical protein